MRKFPNINDLLSKKFPKIFQGSTGNILSHLWCCSTSSSILAIPLKYVAPHWSCTQSDMRVTHALLRVTLDQELATGPNDNRTTTFWARLYLTPHRFVFCFAAKMERFCLANMLSSIKDTVSGRPNTCVKK